MFHYGKLDINNAIIEIVQSDTRIEDTDHVFLSTESDFLGTSYIGQVWDRPTLPKKEVTMRQARLALQQSGLLQSIIDNIAAGTDETMKIEWEYATTVDRNWPSLVALTTSMGMTVQQVDDLFALAKTL